MTSDQINSVREQKRTSRVFNLSAGAHGYVLFQAADALMEGEKFKRALKRVVAVTTGVAIVQVAANFVKQKQFDPIPSTSDEKEKK